MTKPVHDIRANAFQPFDQGDWIRRPDRPETHARTNATLLSGVNPQTDLAGSNSIDLWVAGVTSSFGIAGSFAQSRHRRSFFARNLAQVAFVIEGQAPNQYEFGRLAEFVRTAQMDVLLRSTQMRLTIPGGGTPAKRNMKGVRRAIDVIGYIEGFDRAHERWVNAPDYQFSFVISRSLSGLFRDEPVRVPYLRSWADIFKDPKFQAQFIDDPDLHLPDDQTNQPNGALHPHPSNQPPEHGSRNPTITPPGR